MRNLSLHEKFEVLLKVFITFIYIIHIVIGLTIEHISNYNF